MSKKIHELTVFKRDFVAVKKGEKKCELRPDEACEQKYNVGDILRIEETENAIRTGRSIDVVVTHITTFRAEGQNWALMSFKKKGKK